MGEDGWGQERSEVRKGAGTEGDKEASSKSKRSGQKVKEGRNEGGETGKQKAGKGMKGEG